MKELCNEYYEASLITTLYSQLTCLPINYGDPSYLFLEKNGVEMLGFKNSVLRECVLPKNWKIIPTGDIRMGKIVVDGIIVATWYYRNRDSSHCGEIILW
jgi:hypothetical protein